MFNNQERKALRLLSQKEAQEASREMKAFMVFSKDTFYNDLLVPLYKAGLVYEIQGGDMIARWQKRGGVITDAEGNKIVDANIATTNPEAPDNMEDHNSPENLNPEDPPAEDETVDSEGESEEVPEEETSDEVADENEDDSSDESDENTDREKEGKDKNKPTRKSVRKNRN